PAAPTDYPLSLHDALPIYGARAETPARRNDLGRDDGMQMEMLVGIDVIEREPARAKSLELRGDLRRHLATHGRPERDRRRKAHRSEEHTSELQSRFELVCR